MREESKSKSASFHLSSACGLSALRQTEKIQWGKKEKDVHATKNKLGRIQTYSFTGKNKDLLKKERKKERRRRRRRRRRTTTTTKATQEHKSKSHRNTWANNNKRMYEQVLTWPMPRGFTGSRWLRWICFVNRSPETAAYNVYANSPWGKSEGKWKINNNNNKLDFFLGNIKQTLHAEQVLLHPGPYHAVLER